MLKFVEELRKKAKAGDRSAAEKYDRVMECLKSVDENDLIRFLGDNLKDGENRH